MTPEYSPYSFILVLAAAAAVFALAPLAIAWGWARWFSPPKTGEDKGAIYECGLKSGGDAWTAVRPHYYIYGIIFLVFDVEAVFLIPFAVSFTSLSAGAFVALLVFLFLLVEGLIWCWQKGALDWGNVKSSSSASQSVTLVRHES
jgi:NADH-quinone oxidoreductase subunit A